MVVVVVGLFVAWLLAKAFPRLAIIAGAVALARCCYYLVAVAVGVKALGFFWGSLFFLVALIPILLLSQVALMLVTTGVGRLRGTETNLEGKYDDESPAVAEASTKAAARPLPASQPSRPGVSRYRRAQDGFSATPWIIAEIGVAVLATAYFYWPRR